MPKPNTPFTIRLKPVTVRRIRQRAQRANPPVNPHTWLALAIDAMMKPEEVK